MLQKNQATKLTVLESVDKTAKQFFDARHQLKYNVQPDWSNQIITIYFDWTIQTREMISYHFTGIIFIHGFITLISTHNKLCNKMN